MPPEPQQIPLMIGAEPSSDGNVCRLTVIMGPVGGALVFPMAAADAVIEKIRAAKAQAPRIISAAEMPVAKRG